MKKNLNRTRLLLCYKISIDISSTSGYHNIASYNEMQKNMIFVDFVKSELLWETAGGDRASTFALQPRAQDARAQRLIKKWSVSNSQRDANGAPTSY